MNLWLKAFPDWRFLFLGTDIFCYGIDTFQTNGMVQNQWGALFNPLAGIR
jgi:hypothetical protein